MPEREVIKSIIDFAFIIKAQQLLTVLQLEEEARRHHDREVPARARCERGYKFQFITLAGFHALNFSMFQLAKGYGESQMTAYVKLQQEEFGAEPLGYTATKHQREVGAVYFDEVTQVVTGGQSSVTAMSGPRRSSNSGARERGRTGSAERADRSC